MKNENENLEKLLRQFMDDAKARETEDDLAYADRLFSESPAPTIRPEAFVSIQTRIQRKLKHRHYWHFAKEALAFAAVLTIVTLAGLHTLYSDHSSTSKQSFSEQTNSTDNLWNNSLYAMNSDTDPIRKELADLAESIRMVGEDIYEPANVLSTDSLEMEFDEIQSLTENRDFWKG